MSDEIGLQFVEAPPVPETFNSLLFGPIGSGKSTAAARLARYGPVLWLNLQGSGALAYPRRVARRAGGFILEAPINVAEVRRPGQSTGIDAHEELRKFVRYARDGDPKPATAVIDTIGNLRDALATQYVVPRARDSREQWGEVARILMGAILMLRDLPLNLVLLAHQDISEGDGEGRLIRPKIGGAMTESIPSEMDVVAYTHVQVVEDESAPGRRRKLYWGQLADGNGRTGLKDRSEGALGIYRALDLAEWLETYRADFRADEADLPWGEDYDGEDDAEGPDTNPNPAGDVDLGPDDPEAPGGQMDLDAAKAEAGS